jgi:hypothetical protein
VAFSLNGFLGWHGSPFSLKRVLAESSFKDPAFGGVQVFEHSLNPFDEPCRWLGQLRDLFGVTNVGSHGRELVPVGFVVALAPGSQVAIGMVAPFACFTD